MNEAELGTLVTRLTGESSGLRSALREATGSIQAFADNAVRALEAMGGAAFLKTSFEAFDKFEMANVRLEGSISGTEKVVEESAKHYREFAASLQEVSGQSRIATMELLATNAAMGKGVKESEEAVKVSMALGRALNESTDSAMMQLRLYESGHTARLKMRLGVKQDISDQELQVEMQKRVDAGWRIMQKEAETTGGLLKKLSNLWDDLKISLGAVVDEGVRPVVQWLSMAVKTVNSLSPETKRLIVQIAAVTVVLLALGPALTIAQIALAPLIGLFKLLIIDLILGSMQLALHVAWVVAVSLAQLAWGAVLLGVKVAIWLVNFGLAAMGASFLLLGVTVPIVVAAFLALGGAVSVVAAAGIAAYKSVSQLFAILGQSSELSVAMSAIGGMFKEWWEILKNVVRAAKVDLPLAGKIAAAGWELAMEQIRSLWNQNMLVIETVAAAAAEYIGTVFKMEFKIALAEMWHDFTKFIYDKSGYLNLFPDSEADKRADKAREKLKNDRVRDARQEAVDKSNAAQVALTAALKNINVEEGERVKKAREALKVLVDQIPEEAKKAKEIEPPKIKPPPPVTVKVNLKFDTALFGSQEARARIQEFQDTLLFGSINGKGGGRGGRNAMGGGAGGAIAANADAAWANDQRQTALLEELRDLAKVQAAKGREQLGAADLQNP